MSEHRILCGDVLDGLRTLPDACVQCTVTSPPYYGLRNYGVDGQIGLEETPEKFVSKIVEVFREVRRVTREDGVLWLNLGDSYAGSGCGWQKEGGSSIKREWVEDYNGRPPGYISSRQENGIKPKDLMGIPWKVAFALQNDGWYFRSAIPWIKRNCMPESTTDRPTSAIEYIFLMAKSAKYYYDGEAIRCPSADAQGYLSRCQYDFNGRPGCIMPSGKEQETAVRGKRIPKGFKKQDQTGNPTYTGFNERYKKSRNHSEEEAAFGPSRDGFGRAGDRNGDQITRNRRNSDWFFESWQGLYSESENPLAFIINPQARPELHFATFPDLLAATCIKAGTSEYGCCPKCGKPWERIVEKSLTDTEGWGNATKDHTGNLQGAQSCIRDGKGRCGTSVVEQKGWRPGCACDAGDTVPCVVLDPFMGSGTVAVVARELNRSSVGCELNPEYVKIIRKRLNADSQLDTGVVSYRFEKVPS